MSRTAASVALGSGEAAGDPPDTATPSQRARRERILTAALALAADGGYDAVQMREVAERAEVALGTLYRYFPSKVHLLVAAMAQELAKVRDRALSRMPRDLDVQERVLQVLTRVTEALGRNRQVSEAMVRALMSADASVAADVERVSTIMTSIVSLAGHPDDEPATESETVVAQIIGKVWLSDIVSWLGERMTLAEVHEDLAVTLRTVLPRG